MAEQEWDYSGSGSNGTVTGSTFGPSSNSCIPIPAYHPSFIHVMQSFVSVTTFLSILGSILIVGTFIAFKNLRTRARQILVQLSIADFAVAASQLVAVNANLKRFAGHVCMGQEQADTNFSSDVFCRVQGGLTIFFTVGSFFWTIAVALFLLTVIVFESQRVGKWLTYISYPVCWGVPAVIVVVFRLRNSIGFHANVDTGNMGILCTALTSPLAKRVITLGYCVPPGNIGCFLLSHGYCTCLVHGYWIISLVSD